MTANHYNLEACVTSFDEALFSSSHGAHRLEVCSRIETEGMTPGIELVAGILEKVSIPVRVMIRETENGYEADEEILNKMISSIEQLKVLPLDGFVLGVLKNNRLDTEAMEKLLKVCDPYPVTFHKAIDQSADKWNDLEWLNAQYSVDVILTSGGAEKAVEGIDEIIKMKSVFQKNIMAAGRITPEQLEYLHEQLGLKWYHGRRIV